MKVVKIDNQSTMVFVLKETDESLVYIPITHLVPVDYERLLEIEAKGGEMMREMAKTTLSNGRNALVNYDQVIQVLRYNEDKKSGTRVKRPGEKKEDRSIVINNEAPDANALAVIADAMSKMTAFMAAQAKPQEQAVAPDAPARKRPGPKPGWKAAAKQAAQAQE